MLNVALEMIEVGRVAFIIIGVSFSIDILSFCCANAKVAFIIPVLFPIILPSLCENALPMLLPPLLLTPKIPIAKTVTKKIVVKTIFIKKVSIV
jgi:hypothetical protein